MPRRLLALSSSLLVLSSLCAVARAHAAGSAAARSAAEPTAWTSYANDNQLRNSASSSSLTRQSVPRLASDLDDDPRRRRLRLPARIPRGRPSAAVRCHRGRLGLRARRLDRGGGLEARPGHGHDCRLRHVGDHVHRRDRSDAGPALRDRRDGKPARARPLDRGGVGGLSGAGRRPDRLRVRLGRPEDRRRAGVRPHRLLLRRGRTRRPVPGRKPEVASARPRLRRDGLGSRSRPAESRRHLGLGRHLGRSARRVDLHRCR